MIEEIRNYSIDYLNDKISVDKYIMECKKLYNNVVSDYARINILDNLVIIPFIHEFAYCEYNDSELKSRVLFFLSVLNGEENYCYSTFLKIQPPDKNKTEEIYLFDNLYKTTVNDLISVFNRNIEIPLTIKDIINNIIFDIIDRLDLEQVEESCFNYVNCNENISFSHIEEIIMRLVSYYLGIDTMYIQISINAKGRFFYVN